jgi:hypothetical protein
LVLHFVIKGEVEKRLARCKELPQLMFADAMTIEGKEPRLYAPFSDLQKFLFCSAPSKQCPLACHVTVLGGDQGRSLGPWD